MAPPNTAASLPVARALLHIGPAPYPTVGKGEIIVKVAAAAVNPLDYYIQDLGEKLISWLQYPYISGADVAGTVVEVGSEVTRFKAGDRVVGYAASFESRAGGFQNYIVLDAQLTSPIPDDLSFTDASVLPLGFATAGCGLYQKDMLALEYPSLDPSPKPNGKTLLIWSGASSVGSNAIQLAVASGYEVITTSSPKNFEYCKRLGASQVFDYHLDAEVITRQLIDAFSGKECAGGFAVQPGSEGVVFEVVRRSSGKKFVVCAREVPEGTTDGIEAKMVIAGFIKNHDVGDVLFTDILPALLAQKKIKCVPEPHVVGHGLEHLQKAFDQGKSGTVSARKLVITL
ncbi:GroES-like protein [Xylaria intraflava]|nr:GroES-like protein [Xylaria intraflava]